MSMIATFYEGKSILITGATGFLGKVLLEKLLRISPGLRVIYILVRLKPGQTLQQRVDKMLSCKLFDKVNEECPNVHKKIRAIYADLNHQNLGISKEDMQEMLVNTNLIFHCAATVRFSDSLRNSVQINVIATQKLLHMASQMSSLEAFIHISTAYSNCNLKHIDEVVYPCPMEPQQIIAAMEWLDDAIIDEITPKLLGDRPNTYTYTKALAEMVVQAEGQNLNIAIVRPSIVGATWQEPFPGWVDNLYGPNAIIIAVGMHGGMGSGPACMKITGSCNQFLIHSCEKTWLSAATAGKYEEKNSLMRALLLVTGKGLLHTLKVSPRAVADFIPVDTVVNLLLAVGWYTAVHRPKSTRIYHCTSGTLNPCKWGEMVMHIMATLEKAPLERAFRIPKTTLAATTVYMEYWNAVRHFGPAAIYDLFLWLTGRKPRFLNIINRILKTVSVLEYFATQSWEWSMNNTEMLMAELGPEDQQMFNFDVHQLDWVKYFENYVLGVKQYLLKEDMSRIPKAKEHLKKLQNMQYLFNMTLVLLTWRLLITRSQVVRNAWFFLVNFCYKLLNYLREFCPLKI